MKLKRVNVNTRAAFHVTKFKKLSGIVMIHNIYSTTYCFDLQIKINLKRAVNSN